jgi:hypothetical protein
VTDPPTAGRPAGSIRRVLRRTNLRSGGHIALCECADGRLRLVRDDRPLVAYAWVASELDRAVEAYEEMRAVLTETTEQGRCVRRAARVRLGPMGSSRRGMLADGGAVRARGDKSRARNSRRGMGHRKAESGLFNDIEAVQKTANPSIPRPKVTRRPISYLHLLRSSAIL